MTLAARHARLLVWLLAMIPIAALIAGLEGRDFTSAPAILNALGRVTGVAGLALLLLAATLSARVPGFDRPFGGLTSLWNTHHLLGAWSLVLLLAHPLLLAMSAGARGVEPAMATLFPPLSNIGSWAGWAALILMMSFLAPSFHFFGSPNYERWKKIHRLAGPAVILALVHTFYLSRTMPGWVDIVVWSFFALLAVGAVIWRFVFSSRIGRLSYTVSEVTPVANNVVELVLDPDRKILTYEAGNFVYLTLRDQSLAAGYNEEHPYTLSSAPGECRLRIAIKALGDASRAAADVQPGTPALVEGPYGRFFKSPHVVANPELWIAGGIGVTPFLGRMRHLDGLGKPADVCMIFCVQDEAREIYGVEVRELAGRIEGFNLKFHRFYREGPLSTDYLERVCPDWSGREIYICGPSPLNRLVRHHAASADVPSSRINSEEFELL